MPSSTGVGPLGFRTNPASTRPMKVMNRPMPTEMAVLSWVGTARSTAVRNPVSTRIVMMMPSMTTRPIASAQVMPGSLAMPNATNALRPEAGGEREREVRDDAHEDGHDARDERGRRRRP